MSAMSVSRAHRMMWVLDGLHEVGESDQQRLTVPIPEMIMWSNGRPVKWYFSSSDTKVLMRRHSHRLTPDKMISCFKTHALRERQRLGVHSPVAVALSRGKFGVVDAELLDLDGLVNLIDLDEKETPKRNLLVLQAYTKPKAAGTSSVSSMKPIDSKIGSIDGIYQVQYIASGHSLPMQTSSENNKSMEGALGLPEDSRLECWHTRGWPRRDTFQRTGRCDIDSFRSRTLCSAMAQLVQRVEKVHDVRLRTFACIFHFNTAACIASLVQIQFTELTTDPNIPRGAEWSSESIGIANDEVLPSAGAAAAAAIVEASAAANGGQEDTAANDINGTRPIHPIWRPTSAHNTIRNRPSSAAPVSTRGRSSAGGRGVGARMGGTRPQSATRPLSSGAYSQSTASRRAHKANQPSLLMPGGRMRPAMASSLSESELPAQQTDGSLLAASAGGQHHMRHSASAPSQSFSNDSAALENGAVVVPLRQAEYDIQTAALESKEDDVARCLGDYCSNDLVAMLSGGVENLASGSLSGINQGMKGVRSKVYRLPFKSVLCARAEDSLLGEGMLGAVSSQCMHLAAKCHEVDDPFGLGLNSADISTVLQIAERLGTPPEAAVKNPSTSVIPEEGEEVTKDEDEVPHISGNAPGVSLDEKTDGVMQQRLVVEEAVRRAIRRRFTQLDQAWRSEALLRCNGPLTNLKASIKSMDRRQRKELAHGVAPLKLWEYEDSARASCYMSALGNLHPSRYYRGVPLCACCFIIYSSLDDQRTTMDKQRSRERQIIAQAAVVADRKERIEQTRHNGRVGQEGKDAQKRSEVGDARAAKKKSKHGRPPKVPKTRKSSQNERVQNGVNDGHFLEPAPEPEMLLAKNSSGATAKPLLVTTATGASPAIAPPSTVAEQAQALLERGGSSYMVDTACGPSPAVVVSHDTRPVAETQLGETSKPENAGAGKVIDVSSKAIVPDPVSVPTPISDLLNEATERVINSSRLPSDLDRPNIEVPASEMASSGAVAGACLGSNFAHSEQRTKTPLSTSYPKKDNLPVKLPPAEILRPPPMNVVSNSSRGAVEGLGEVAGETNGGYSLPSGLPTKGTQVRQLKEQLEATLEREQKLRDQLKEYQCEQTEAAERHYAANEALNLSLQREFTRKANAASPNLSRSPSLVSSSRAKAAARCGSTARDKSPHLAGASSPLGYPGGVSASGEGLVRAPEEDEEERLPVDKPLPRRHAMLLFDHICRTTEGVEGGDLKAEIQHREVIRPRHRGDKTVKRSAGPHSEKQSHYSAKRISEPQLALALRQWRLRRAQSHRQTENQRLIGRVLSALQRCDVTIDEWVDALMVRRLARSVKPIKGHRRGRGQTWYDNGSSPGDSTPSHTDNLTQADLLKELRLLANMAARHPHSAVHRLELLAMESPMGMSSRPSPYTDGQNSAGGFKSFNTVSSWVLLPEEMERFVYLLLRKAHDDEHGEGDGSKKLLSASTLVQPRHLRSLMYSCQEEDEEVDEGGVGASIEVSHGANGGWSSDDGARSDSKKGKNRPKSARQRKPRLGTSHGRRRKLTKKERDDLVDQAFLWLDSYLRLHQLRPSNLLRDMVMPAAVERGKYLHTDGIEAERNSFQPGGIIDERKRIRSTTGEPPSAVTLAEFCLELCPPKNNGDGQAVENRPPSSGYNRSIAGMSRPKSREFQDNGRSSRPGSSSYSNRPRSSSRDSGNRAPLTAQNGRPGSSGKDKKEPHRQLRQADEKPVWDARLDPGEGNAWGSTYSTAEVVRIYDPSRASSRAGESASEATLAAAKAAGAIASQSRRLLDEANNASLLGGNAPAPPNISSAQTTDSFGFDDPRVSQMISQTAWMAMPILQDMAVTSATPVTTVTTPGTTTTTDAIFAVHGKHFGGMTGIASGGESDEGAFPLHQNGVNQKIPEPILPRRELPLQAYIGVGASPATRVP